MTALVRPDLNQIRPDADSFLGQALDLGRRYGRLPESILDVLMAYLRARGLGFAQRHRSGIAIGREGLEKGVTQALTCMDLGLEKAAEGDLNRAVELLADGDLESLRQPGWELAFARLQEMRQRSSAALAEEEALWLQDSLHLLERWSRVVPETWLSHDAEGEAQPVDPLVDYPLFTELLDQLAFLRSLPPGSLRGLGEPAGEGETFDQVLRHLVLALALDRTELAPKPGDAARARKLFAEGRMRPEVRQKVLRLLDDHLDEALPDPDARTRLRGRIEKQIAALEEESADSGHVPG